MEREPAEFRAMVNKAYRDLADQFGWTVVDGTAPVDEVADRVWELIQPLV
jgi:thymidylate kinase